MMAIDASAPAPAAPPRVPEAADNNAHSQQAAAGTSLIGWTT